MEQTQTRLQLFYNQLLTFAIVYGGRVLLAILTLIVGLWVDATLLV